MTTNLTKQDLKCLKNSDSICFDFNNDRKQEESQIRCNQTGSKTNTGFDQTHYIKCESRFDIYVDKEGSNYQTISYTKPVHCFGWVSSPKYDNVWQSILTNIKENDSIILDWKSCSDGYIKGCSCTVKSDNGSYIARDERIYKDDLYITILKSTGKRLTFHLETSICPNNSARMIKM